MATWVVQLRRRVIGDWFLVFSKSNFVKPKTQNQKLRTLFFAPLLLCVFALSVSAQDSEGQLWVRSFEDRDASGRRDAGEPLLTSGVVVELLNADGIVIASGALDGAPYAAQGLIGFQGLAPGTYTAVISVGELMPTTPQRVDATVSENGVPPVIEFGAQAAAAPVETDVNTEFINSEAGRITLAGIGALIVAGVMLTLGFLIYTFVLRPRHVREVERARMLRSTTGSMRPVMVDAPHEDEV